MSRVTAVSATVIECALNGPWTRQHQPLIPVSIEECVADGIACARAGATVIHVHPYDPQTGRQKDDWEIYARIIEGIRSQVDVPVYPTIPLGEAGGPALDGTARYAATEALAARGLLELAAVDPGSVNFTQRTGAPGFVYANPEEHTLHALALMAKYRVVPAYAIYEAGFLRAGAALHSRVPDAPPPVYRFMFSSDFLFGFPPETWGLEALLRLKETCAPDAPWMVSGLGVDVSGLIADAVRCGGHVRVGLEDAPLGNTRSNVAWVEHAVGCIERAGGTIADVATARGLLGLSRRDG